MLFFAELGGRVAELFTCGLPDDVPLAKAVDVAKSKASSSLSSDESDCSNLAFLLEASNLKLACQ